MIPLLRRPGRFAVIGSGENMWDMVHVDDVALRLRARARDGAGGRDLPLRRRRADDVPRVHDAHRARRSASAARARSRSWLARRVAGEGPVATVVRSGRTSNAKLKAELGWQPRYPDSREGIPAAVAALGRRLKGSELV